MINRFTRSIFILFFICGMLSATVSYAGPVNPNISVIGQIVGENTDDATTGNAGKTTLGMGETKIQCDTYLNPYAKGVFVFSIDSSSGTTNISVEEAYMTIFKGLPDGIGVRLGKWRAIFGKINPVHPHALPFIVAPRVLTSMLPMPAGDDGYNETAAQVSYLLPLPGSWASVLSFDYNDGSAFHPDETQSASGWLGRWSNSFLINDVTPLEIGMSATQGTNSVQWGTKTTVYGADFKTKIPLAVTTKLTLQGEYYNNQSDLVSNTATGASSHEGRSGFYAFGDMAFWERWNGGLIYDQFNPVENPGFINKAIKAFLNFSLLEETTLFRLTYENYVPQAAPVDHTVMLQVLFSMGPHKAHQY